MILNDHNNCFNLPNAIIVLFNPLIASLIATFICCEFLFKPIFSLPFFTLAIQYFCYTTLLCDIVGHSNYTKNYRYLILLMNL